MAQGLSLIRGPLPVLLILGLGCVQQPSEDSAKPANLVVVCLDTVRFDTFWLPETAGTTDALGPWLDQALVLANTQAPSPWTVPSVASALTGLYPNQHGAGRFEAEVANLNEEVPAGLAETLQTLPEILSAHGYDTAAFVAHPWFKAGYGLDRGFASLRLVKRREQLLAAAFDGLQRRSTSQAADEITPNPFLLYLHFMEAHGARRLRGQQLDEAIASIPQDLKPRVLDHAPGGSCKAPDSRPCRRYLAYVATVLDLRETVAELLQGLADRGLSDRTITVVFSDHGEEFRDHYQAEEARGTDPRGYYGTGHGHSLYQELLHVPALIWHPGHPGRTIDQPASLIDFMPTLLGWLAVPSPRSRWPGEAISGLIATRDRARPPQRHLFSSAIAYGPEQVAIRFGAWKRVRYAAEHRDLFDLARDPAERQPMAAIELAASLDQRLDQYLAVEPVAGKAAPAISDEELERLQSLGYLQGVKPND